MASNKNHALEALRVVLPLLILACGAGGFMAIGGRRDPGARQETGPQAPLVQTVAVEPHAGDVTIETDGVVVPFREITLAAEVAGRVEFKNPKFRPGSYVAKDTLLARIDPATYQLEVDRLTSEVNQAQANLDELAVEEHSTASLVELSEEQLTLEEKSYQRSQRLIERNIIGEAEIDTAQQALISARNNATTLRNQLQMVRTRRTRLQWAKKLAEARLDQAELDLKHTEIRAPVDGVIVSDLIEQESYLQPGATIATLEDTSAVEVRCSLRMEELHWVWQQAALLPSQGAPGDSRSYTLPPVPVTVVYNLAGEQYAWEGVLSRYDGIGLDEKTRTVPCRVLVREPLQRRLLGTEGPAAGGPPALLRGMFVAVHIHTNPGLSLLKVPDEAVRPGCSIWRVRDNRLEVLRVQPAQRLDDGLLVAADRSILDRGDRVVVSPLASVQNGMTVREGDKP